MIVIKFGGTSVGSAEAMTRTMSIIESKLEDRPLVVVSACSGVTDALYAIAAKAERGEDFAWDIEALKERHHNIARELGLPEDSEIHSTIDSLAEEVNRNALEISSCDEDPTANPMARLNKAALISLGEMFSSRIIQAAMVAKGIDMAFFYAPFAMKASGEALCGEPDKALLESLVREKLSPVLAAHTCVITQGFIASSHEGLPMILGRGGSDYSASLFGAALDADRVEIWTDVDGVRSADPRIVSTTRGLSKISYEEAAELARFGAKVLHPLTMEPVQAKNIPLYVLNSHNPSDEGTAIMPKTCICDGVKSISYKENIKVINIYSLKMINTAGFMQKVFTVFGQHGVSLDLLSSSEASITVTVDNNQNLDGVMEDLAVFAECQVDRDKSQISIIGKNLIDIPGTLTRIFTALENTKLYMISQGASFLNFSVVVDRPEMKSVISRLHRILF